MLSAAIAAITSINAMFQNHDRQECRIFQPYLFVSVAPVGRLMGDSSPLAASSSRLAQGAPDLFARLGHLRRGTPAQRLHAAAHIQLEGT